MKQENSLQNLLEEVRICRVCEPYLPLGPRPVLRAREEAKILIVGQAPGTRVHRTGIPWNDPSGDRLRLWMGVDKKLFYDETKFAIIPMGFCYPGKGKSGDLPPRKECSELWHSRLLEKLPNIQLSILAGQYAQHYYLKNKPRTLTETVQNWKDYFPRFLPLPHPSPRNQLWLKKNPWFEEEVVPALKSQVDRFLSQKSDHGKKN